MNKLLVICGPTATGKTKTAIQIAKKFNGELISADSRQVYKFMDIGTGKDLPVKSKIKNLRQRRIRLGRKISKLQIKNQKWTVGYHKIKGIPLWLCDVVNPDQNFSVADYYELAWLVIKDIWRRGKLPILVGGTGFYIKAVLDGIGTMGIPPDRKLRNELEKKSLTDLQNQLKKIDQKRWELMNDSDRNNPRRLVRAIEIASQYQISKISAKGGSASGGKYQKYRSKIKNKLNALIIGLTADREVLYKKIDKRVEKRIKQGIIEEIRSLLNKGYGWDLYSMSGLGYRQWKGYFDKKETLKEIIQKWKYAEHDFARRQLTWFKKDSRVNWFTITEENFQQMILKLIINWYNK